MKQELVIKRLARASASATDCFIIGSKHDSSSSVLSRGGDCSCKITLQSLQDTIYDCYVNPFAPVDAIWRHAKFRRTLNNIRGRKG